jgi:hypothetical protein
MGNGHVKALAANTKPSTTASWEAARRMAGAGDFYHGTHDPRTGIANCLEIEPCPRAPRENLLHHVVGLLRLPYKRSGPPLEGRAAQIAYAAEGRA